VQLYRLVRYAAIFVVVAELQPAEIVRHLVVSRPVDRSAHGVPGQLVALVVCFQAGTATMSGAAAMSCALRR
jgi:hypothetical protein